MDTNTTIAQVMGLRRVAADLDRGWGDFLQGARNPDNEEFAGEEFAGCMLAPPILRAFAAELALRAMAVKTAAPRTRRKQSSPRHDLLDLFDALDQSTRARIEQQFASTQPSWTSESVRSILEGHKDDFNAWRYLGQRYHPGMVKQYVYGGDLDAALRALIAAFRELPAAGPTSGQRAGFST